MLSIRLSFLSQLILHEVFILAILDLFLVHEISFLPETCQLILALLHLLHASFLAKTCYLHKISFRKAWVDLDQYQIPHNHHQILVTCKRTGQHLNLHISRYQALPNSDPHIIKIIMAVIPPPPPPQNGYVICELRPHLLTLIMVPNTAMIRGSIE